MTLEAEDQTGAKATKSLSVLVCGFETVTAKQPIKSITTRSGLVQKFTKSSMVD